MDENAKAAPPGGEGGLQVHDQLGERIERLDTATQVAVQGQPREFRLLADIKIGERHRKDMGDIKSLAASMQEVGLLHPPVITPENILVAGARRCAAWRLWKGDKEPIPVRIVDLAGADVVRGERAENVDRKDFRPSEIVAIKRALEPKLKVEARDRQVEAGKHKSEAVGKFPEASKGRAADKVAAFVGKDRKTIEKMEAVVAAAEAEPEKFGKLLEDMDRTGSVNGPFKRLRNVQAADAIRKEPPPLPMRGPYRAGIIDVPWASEPNEDEKDHDSRGYFPYPTMTPDPVAAMPVPTILHADASVWLWITNFHLMHGHHLTIAKAWGLKPVTLLTWVKDKFGQGQRARGATEHVVQLIRGNVACLGTSTPTWFDGKGGVHSQKPVEFYDIVEKLTPAPRYFELFSRAQPREGWDLHGDQVGTVSIVAKREVPAPTDIPNIPSASATAKASDSPVNVSQLIDRYLAAGRHPPETVRRLRRHIRRFAGPLRLNKVRSNSLLPRAVKRRYTSHSSVTANEKVWAGLVSFGRARGWIAVA